MAYYIKYEWDFGDGTVGYEKNPDHIYRMPGTYTVVCTITDEFGNQFISDTYTITVYDYGTSFGSGFILSKTTNCLRFAIPQKPSQGKGWSVYDDVYEGERTYGWPFPVTYIGTCRVRNAADKPVPLVLDSETFRIFELGSDDNWRDAEGDYAGSEIESDITMRELMPPVGASAKLKHNQTHAWLKPWRNDRRNVGEYNAEGFREGFESDMYIRTNSEPSDYAIAKQTPLGGQIVYDRHIESTSLQPGIRLRVAPWRLIKLQQWHEQIDTAAAPEKKEMRELEWSLEYSEPALWISRNDNTPLMNLATGITGSGTYAGKITGPDGYSQSALAMAAANTITSALSNNISADFSISVWLKDILSDTKIIYLPTGTLSIKIDIVDSAYRMEFDDNTNSVNIAINSDFTDWTLITIKREGENVILMENGSINNTVRLTDAYKTYGGTARMFDGICSFFDIRIVERAVSLFAAQYMYNDITQNKGDAVCPLF